MDSIPRSTATPPVLTLLDAPDEGIGDVQKEQSTSHALQISLPQPVVEELVKCSDSGKPLQLSFGSAPFLRFGDASRSLQISATNFRRELYKSAGHNVSLLHFNSVIGHSAVIADAKEATKGAESALATLQASLAQYKKDKEDNSATFIRNNTAKPGQTSKRGTPGNNNKLTNNKSWRKPALFQTLPRSIPSSPSLAPQSKLSSINNSKSHNPSLAPTSIPSQTNSQSASKVQAQRFVLVHYLALGPASEASIIKTAGISKDDLLSLLEKVAEPSSANPSEWILRDRWFKELKVWTFKYPSSEKRQAAVDNAIRAFDRQRVSKEDKLWQLLLPKEKRGKGIVLSKLNIGTGNNLANKAPPNREEPNDSADNTQTVDNTQTALISGEDTMSPARNAKGGQAAKTKPTAMSSVHQSAVAHQSDSQSPAKKRKSSSSIEKPTNFGDPEEGSDEMPTFFSSRNQSEAENKTKPGVAVKKRDTAAKSKAKTNSKVKSDEFIQDSDDLDDGLEAESRPTKRAKTENTDSQPANKNSTRSKIVTLSTSGAAKNGAVKKGEVTQLSKDNKLDRTAASTTNRPKAAMSAQDASTKVTSNGTQSQKETITKPAAKSQPNQPNNRVMGNHRHSSSLPSNALRATSPLKRSPESQLDGETSFKKHRPNGQNNFPRQRSTSSPLTNTSELPSVSTPSEMRKSPLITAKTPSKTNGELTPKTAEIGRKASIYNGAANARVPNGINGKPQSHSPPDATLAAGDPKVMLRQYQQEYHDLFRKHLEMHLAFDKLPLNAEKDEKAYRRNNKDLEALTGMIGLYMRRCGMDDTKFSAIPPNFSTAEIPGLVDYIQGKLSGLKKAYREEKERIKANGATPATRKRLDNLTKEIEELESLRDH